MRITTLAVTVAAIGLSACSTLNGKSAHEMVQHSIERSLTKDYSYNYHGEIKAYLSPPDKGEAPDTAAASAAASSVAVDSETTMQTGENETSEPPALLGGKAADWLQANPALARYLENGRLKYTGAVDLRRKQIEFIPELTFNNHNENSSIRMPMLFDGNDMSLTADMPASIPVILNFFVEPKLRERLINEPLRITLTDAAESFDTDGKIKQLPVKSAVKAAYIAILRAYGDIPAQYYTALPPDSYAKQAGAKYRIRYVEDATFEKLYLQAAAKHFRRELDRLQKEAPEKGIGAEKYEELKQWADSLADTGELPSNASLVGVPILTDWYLDRKGRIVGMRSFLQANGKEKALNISSVFYMHNFNRPKFTFQPKQGKTISWKELADAVTAQKNARYGKDESEDGGEIGEPNRIYEKPVR
ncbi:hypothetical protein [Neisseria dentiae]|uniref:hypothetical protein n=1 Tax=Neisseria dentiae TaxID=194197 RepID=UPI00359FAB86